MPEPIDRGLPSLPPDATSETRIGPAPNTGEKTALPAPETLAVSPAAVDSLPAPSVQVPGYEVLGELGRGGMGVVYKARQKGLNRLVALKMVLAGVHASRDELQRFRREAEAIARLHHPNIVQIYEIDEHEGRPFFSMEYVAGDSLANWLSAIGNRLSPQEAASLTETLARAVHYAHQQGIVHRDLKPANVLLQENPSRRAAEAQRKEGDKQDSKEAEKAATRAPSHSSSFLCASAALREGLLSPKITDFGLAKRLEEQGQTRSGDLLGTPSYMAPEQAAGHVNEIGPATDVWALGAILYELLTGRRPFGKESLLDTLEQVRKEEPVPPRSLCQEVPRDLEVICQKCLRKEPQKRYPSAQELADDLRRFLDGEPIKARPLSRREKAIRWARRRPLLAAMMCALVVVPLALAAGWLWMRPHQYTDEEIRAATIEPRKKLADFLKGARSAEGRVRPDPFNPNSPEFEVWSHAQVLCALLSNPDADPADLRDYVRNLELLFTRTEQVTRKGVHYGWPAHYGFEETQADPALWTAAALAVALRRPGVLDVEQRRRFEGHLRETQEILEVYAPAKPEEGWHTWPNLRDRLLCHTYTSGLALLALLEMRRAGLGWKGSERRRDELLRQTAGWLVRHHDASSATPGWHKDSKSHDHVHEGLSFQVYAMLLRADTEAGVPLPDELLGPIGEQLARCRGRRLDHSDSSAWITYEFVDHEGRKKLGKQNLSYLWYPWAVEACVRWLEHAAHRGATPNETAAVRNALGHLVVALGPEVASEGISFVFVPAERLYALSSIVSPGR